MSFKAWAWRSRRPAATSFGGDGAVSDDARPKVHVIVAWWPEPHLDCLVRPRGARKVGMHDGWIGEVGRVMTLEEGAHYAELGFCVMPDPFDMEALTRYEQLQRSKEQGRR
jgi:hypothetical protein